MPRRYEDDDDDDLDVREPVRRRKELPWLDQQFNNTNIVILVLFALCCGWVALIFSVLGVAICKDPLARRNATIVLAVSVVNICISVVAVGARIALGR